MSRIADYQNTDGTHNGVKFMAAITGLSEAEVAWTWSRLKTLMHELALPKEQALAIVKAEAKEKPWIKTE